MIQLISILKYIQVATTNPPIETITTTTTKYRKQEVNVETLDELKKSYRCSKFNCKYN